MIALEHTYESLSSPFYAKVRPETLVKPECIRLNHGLLQELNLQESVQEEKDWLHFFAGGDQPLLAMAYAGHQFGSFVPSLGDGRALLLGEYVDPRGERRDIQMKGSGRTPFSRGGDGKSWLGAVVREYIVSEGMFSLGIPTTRSLAMIKTGEIVFRTREEQGAMLIRVAKSHIRIGTFQYFAARGDKKSLIELLNYSCSRHGIISEGDEPLWLALLRYTSQRQARLIADWLLVGFIHGVMNTDNMLISGETIDYGPCAFLDEFHPMKVFSSIDVQGRYAFGNQPDIAMWNLMRLADCFHFVEEDKKLKTHYHELAQKELSSFADVFQAAYTKGLKEKLGFEDVGATDKDKKAGDLITDLSSLMTKFATDYTMVFRTLSNMGSLRDVAHQEGYFQREQEFLQYFQGSDAAKDWLQGWKERSGFAHKDANERDALSQKMRGVNPLYIPRNHQIQKAIDALEAGNSTQLERLLFVLASPYREHKGYEDLAQPPKIDERITSTFCGT